MCSERVYQNQLKLVESGQSNTVAITLLKTRMVFSVIILSKWKLVSDFFCEILSVFLHLKEINFILRISIPKKNHISSC